MLLNLTRKLNVTFKQIPITARVNQLRHLSPIWLVPIVAALIGLWLVYATLSNQGPLITMTMVNAEGIEAGKT